MNGRVDTRVEELLERVVRFHPCSLRLLTGEVPDLDPEDIPRLLGGHDAVRSRIFKEALSLIGGWQSVVGAVKAYRKSRPREWEIFADHVIWVEVGGTSRLSGESQMDRIAGKYGVSPDTVQRRRKQVVLTIARMTAPGRTA